MLTYTHTHIVTKRSLYPLHVLRHQCQCG